MDGLQIGPARLKIERRNDHLIRWSHQREQVNTSGKAFTPDLVATILCRFFSRRSLAMFCGTTVLRRLFPLFFNADPLIVAFPQVWGRRRYQGAFRSLAPGSGIAHANPFLLAQASSRQVAGNGKFTTDGNGVLQDVWRYAPLTARIVVEVLPVMLTV